MENLVEGEDYYFNEHGYIVLTKKFHLKKGFCCGNGCKHCPYEYENVPEPMRSELNISSIPHISEAMPPKDGI